MFFISLSFSPIHILSLFFTLIDNVSTKLRNSKIVLRQLNGYQTQHNIFLEIGVNAWEIGVLEK